MSTARNLSGVKIKKKREKVESDFFDIKTTSKIKKLQKLWLDAADLTPPNECTDHKRVDREILKRH